MPIVEPIAGLSHGFGRGEQVPEVQRPEARDVIKASGFYNPVVSSVEYLARDTFKPQEGFNPGDYGGDHELWNDHYESLGRATSSQEFDAISGRIREEQKDRAVLDAAGGWGFTAAIASGVLSPTLFIPLVGQAKGIKGVAQVLAYAGAAASLDEITLLQTRETYTGEEAAIGIAAGTVLGGVLGNASRYMSARQARTFESDLNRYVDGDTGIDALHDNAYIHYSAPEGSSQISERVTFPKASGLTEDARISMDPRELKMLEDIEAGRVEVISESAGLRLSRVSDEVNPTVGKAQSLDSPNFVSKFLNKHLGKLNLVTRATTQNYSQSAKAFIFKLSDAGLRGDGNVDFRPHASEGTVEARLVEYDAFVGQFTLEISDAYARHIEGNRLPPDQLQGEMRARLKASFALPEGKLSSEDFNAEVFRVAQTGETHADGTINKAAASWKKFTDNFHEYAEEAYQTQLAVNPSARRLFDPEGNLGPDAINYVNHVFSDRKIGADTDGFIRMLSDSANEHMQKAWKKDWERYQKRFNTLDARANNLAMTPDESRAAYSAVDDKISELMERPEYVAYRETRLGIEKEIREAKKAGAEPEDLADLKQELVAHRESSPEVKAMLEEEKGLKAERRSYTTTLGKFADKQEELLGKIAKLEEQDLNALETVLNAGGKLNEALRKVSDKALDAGIAKMWKQLGTALKSVETQNKRIASLYSKPMTATERFVAYRKHGAFSERRAKADAKIEELIAKVEGAEKLDRELQRDLLRSIQDLNNVRVRDLNARRAVREEKLREQATEYEPEQIDELLQGAENSLYKLQEDFENKWMGKGAEDVDLDLGTASFAGYSRDTGEHLAEKIQGLHNPIAGLEILGGKRGPELARVLDIPLDLKSKYLETDMEVLSRTYSRNMAPDIELYRATGSVNAAPVFAQVKREFTELRRAIADSKVRPKSAKQFKAWVQNDLKIADATDTIPFTQADKEIANTKITKAQTDMEVDMDVAVRRLRNQRGLPLNPDGIMFRAGRVVKDLNVARYMGSVVPSSVADLGRPVMKYGFTKTFSNGWLPFTKGMDRIRMTRAETRRAGVAWDPVMHNRIQQVMDVQDNYASRKTMGERGIGFLANKTGLVAGFDRWTAEVKQVTASITIGELSEGLRRIHGGGEGDQQWYKTFFAEHGLDEAMSKRIWDQYNLDGGSDVFEDGYRLPNTEAWTDLAAKRAYRAAVNRAVNSTIVTPGIDLPNWVDENMAYSMLAQFKSFTFSSTNRSLLSGAQQGDMALVNGASFSLAMGAVSYYIWAMSIGGDTLDEALKFDQGKWADEAISRSGLLGIFAEPYEIAQKIPATRDLVTFGDQATSRRRATGLVGAALGPSFDFGEKLSSVITGLDEPTQSTLHQARLMGPWQNVFYMRQAIDAVENGVASMLNLPETRGQ